MTATSGPLAAAYTCDRRVPGLYCRPPLVARQFASAGRLPCRCQAAATCDAQVSFHAQPFVRRVPAGEVSIAPLSSAEVSAAAVVLTRAFADGPDALSYSDVSKFLTSLLAVPPEKAQVLVARLAPTGKPSFYVEPACPTGACATAGIQCAEAFRALRPRLSKPVSWRPRRPRTLTSWPADASGWHCRHLHRPSRARILWAL